MNGKARAAVAPAESPIAVAAVAAVRLPSLAVEDCAGTSSSSFSVDWQGMPAMSATLAALLGDCLPLVGEACAMILAELTDNDSHV